MRSMVRAWGLILTLVCAASLASISCERSSNSSGTSSSGGGGGKIKLVYIPKNTGNPYFDPMIDGFKKAAEEAGMDFTTVGPATADATSQLPLIKAQVQRGANVIAISPNSPEALNATFEDAMSRGVTIVTVDSDLEGNEQFRNAAVKTVDPETVGKTQIELMGSLIGYNGKFAILSATTDAPNQNEWIRYMKEALKDPKYKDMQLVEVAYGNDEQQKSATETEALLTKYPDLKGIIAPTTVGVRAAAQVIESAGKAAQVQVTGLGMPNEMRRFIQNGTVKAFALWSPYDEGYLAGHLSYLLATKKLTPAAGTKFDAGKLGQREFRDKNIVITGPPVTFTKENIEQYKF
jgi:rhamnose transport system substrate-binding protein